MSGVDYFDDKYAINPYMDQSVKINLDKAETEHNEVRQSLKSAGIIVTQVRPPKNCQDGVYVANWALCRRDLALLSCLPEARKDEEPYAEEVLRGLGKKIIKPPVNLRFSGQGDALPCGPYLFAGTNYRTDKMMHDFIENKLGYMVIALQTKPLRTWYGKTKNNRFSGWPDSFYYDIDLALAILRQPTSRQKGLIAWCPGAFTRRSRDLLHQFNEVDKIEITEEEAKNGFACNLVSSGSTVIMSNNAPKLKQQLENLGFNTITPSITELSKGGGYIRCTTLTIG